MAKFFPEKQKEIFFENKKEILQNLEKLDDSFEIFLNISNDYRKADLTILKNWFWCFILNFSENEKNIENDLEKIKKNYYNFFDLYIDWLLEEKIKKELSWNKNIYKIVNTGIIFLNLEEKDFKDFKNGKETVKFFDKNLKNLTVSKNIYFTDEFYEKFKKFLFTEIKTENLEKIYYSDKQKSLIFLKKAKNQKIKWFPWSWKTIVLAWRAKNCLERNGGKVLILTFNITLWEYIREKIYEIGWNLNNIIIDHYHNFIWNFLFKGVDFLLEAKNEENFKNIDEKYKFESILIDEVQDFEIEYIDIIKKYFLKKWWEFVVFWDEKQNIYNRKMESDKTPYTSIPWAWNKLDTSFRYVNSEQIDFLNNFQEFFLNKKYEIEKIWTQSSLDFSEKKFYFDYFEIEKENYLEKIYEKIIEIKNKFNLKNKNICIIASEKEILQKLDKIYRDETKEKTITTFESKEIFDIFKEKYSLDKLKIELYNTDKNKKIFFNINSDFIKFSTIQSFKWYEIDTIFFILEEKSSLQTEELIYTWLTRAKNNIIIFNIGNKEYRDFFEKYKK